MNSRERIIATIKRTPTDRVAVGGMDFDEEISAAVCRLLKAPEDTALGDLLGFDVAKVDPTYVGPEFPWKPERTRKSFFGSSDKTYSDDYVERPLRRASSVSDVESFRWPTAADYRFDDIADQCAKVADKAIMTPVWTPTFSQLCEMFGMETALTNVAAEPEMMRACAERIADLNIGLLRGIHKAAGCRLVIFGTADDIATQRALMFRPESWREIFKPSLARQFAAAKELGLFTWMHSCGDVSSILPDLVDIGLDVLEPTQAHLPGMRPEWLKREFGKHLTFFGGISTQTTLPFGSCDDVRREVRERIRVLGEGGGYIVSPDHTVLNGVPPENVVALYEEAGSLQR